LLFFISYFVFFFCSVRFFCCRCLRPVHTSRVHGPYSWPVCAAREHGCIIFHPCPRAVNTGRVEKKHCRAMFFLNTHG